ncbi:MAG TPA: SDR family NAD(P)-dependent oxidoreductase [Candidatus Tectomicrobia bacterium]
MARQLGRQGITVLVDSRHEERGVKAAEGLRSEGISARFLRLDVTSQNTIAQAARRIEEKFDRLDILVNNTGVCIDDTAPSGLDL